MPNREHGTLTPHEGSGIHTAIGWPPFASDADRLAYPLVPTDVGKIALVEDTGRTWMLVRYSPPRWVEWIDGGVLDTALDGKADDSDILSLQQQINQKADAAATQAALAQKADLTYVNTELNAKADQTDLTNLTTVVNQKADQTYVDAQLALKADKSALDALAATSASDAELQALALEVAQKADQADLDAKADASAVSAALATKANQADLDALALEVDGKVDQAYVDAQLALKADITYVDYRLDEKADRTDVDGKADQTYVDYQLGLKADLGYVEGELFAVDARLDALESAGGVDITDKVSGPASATPDALMRYDGATGKLAKDSPALLSDAGDLSIAGSLVTGGTVDGVDLGTLETIVMNHDAELLTVVHGPSSANDNQIPRYDGATGLLLDAPAAGPSIDDGGSILMTTGATVDGYDVSLVGATVDAHTLELLDKVEGPAVSTQRAVARYADASGKLLSDSLVLVDDAGKLTAQSLDVATDIAVGGLVDGVDVAAMKATVDQNTVAISGLRTQSYVTLTSSGDLDNERVLTEGLGTQFTDGGPGGPLSVGQRAGYREVSGALYTLQLSDAFQELAITTDNATVVVPDNAATPFPLYTRLWVTPKVSDRFMPVYFEAAPGVALVTPPGVSDPGGDGATVCLFKIGTDRWHLSGEFDDKTTYLTLDWTGARSNSRILEAGTGVSFDVEDVPNGKVRINATAPGGSGDVTGPASATDNAIARFDTTTGKLLQSSPVSISDVGAITGAASLDLTGNLTLAGTVDGVDVSALNTTVGNKVTGPASSLDNTIPRFDLTTGKVIQGSGLTIDDSNNLGGIAHLSMTGNLTLGAGCTVDGHDINVSMAARVTGPASSVDNTIPRYDATTGKVIQTSGVTIDDSNNMTGVAGLTCTGATVNGSISGVSSLTCTSATVNGNITVTGTVDGVDVSNLNSTVSSLVPLLSAKIVTFGTDATLSQERPLYSGDSIYIYEYGQTVRIDYRPKVSVVSTSITLDHVNYPPGSIVYMTNQSQVNVTIPNYSTYPYPVGSTIRVYGRPSVIGPIQPVYIIYAAGVTMFTHTTSTSFNGGIALGNDNYAFLNHVETNVWFCHGVCLKGPS